MARRIPFPVERMEENRVITGLKNTLLDTMTETCTLLTKTVVLDAMGGYKETYIDGVTFEAVITKDSTTEDRIAEKQGAKESFSVVVSKGFPLRYHDMFRRNKDSETYIVTSNISDSESPAYTDIDVGKVSAEKRSVAE